MPPGHDELLTMAKEQGRLTGIVEGVRDDVADIKTEQAKMRECLTEQCGSVRDINHRLGTIIDVMRDSGIRPAVEAPPSNLMVILKHPATPLAFALVAVTIITLILVSALTGRKAGDLLPAIPTSSSK
jgi:hypothetical protein